MKSERTISTTEKSSKTRRVNVNFSQEAYAYLYILAVETGTTMSEVLRDAIALKKWWEDVHWEGSRVLVERDGNIHEVSRI